VREAAAGYLQRRGVAAQPEDVIVGPGSKALLYAVVAAGEGPVFLPTPCWVSYEAQARLLGREVVRVPISASGGVPDPEALEAVLRGRPRGGSGVLVLTVPDNPTGTVAGANDIGRVCELAGRHGVWVVSDEIYRDLAYDQDSFLSPAALLPEHTIVTSGLSKALALGGWRVGLARFPSTPGGRSLRDRVESVASEIWSALAAPMQEVAAYAFGDPRELREHVGRSRGLHRAISIALHELFSDVGASVRLPQAAFYVYPDFEVHRRLLGERWGIETSADLSEVLLEEHHVGTLCGAAFGDPPERLTLRVAGSLLYGGTEEERWAALRADDPTELPWIRRSLDRVRAGLAALVGA
jgi:aspartate aminotransferase